MRSLIKSRIARNLLDSVDVYGTTFSDYADPVLNLTQAGVPCLVDAASGKRRIINEQGTIDTLDYGVSFGATVPMEEGMVLVNAKDRNGLAVFTRGLVQQIRTYRDPLYGIVGYLALVQDFEITTVGGGGGGSATFQDPEIPTGTRPGRNFTLSQVPDILLLFHRSGLLERLSSGTPDVGQYTLTGNAILTGFDVIPGDYFIAFFV